VIPLPGALEILQALPQDRWTIARPAPAALPKSASVPPASHAKAHDHLRRRPSRKPDPEPYFKAAQILGFPPGECIVVEDAPAGIRAGQAAGTRVLALRTTAPDSELTQSGATWIINDLASLRVIISEHRDSPGLILNVVSKRSIP